MVKDSAKSFFLLKLAALTGAGMLLVACDTEKMEGDKLDSMDLSEKERQVAEALVEGYKKEMGTPILRSRDYGHAGCYAKSVRMPSSYHNVHLKYLRNYTEIDNDFYPWFRSQGLSDDTAYKISEYVQAGFEECTVGNLLKKRFSKE